MDLPVSILIQRGSILHSTLFENIDHGKFFVIMGEDTDNYIGLFFINSDINWFNQKKGLIEMQFPMKQRDYSFLSYDSFLSCTSINRLSKAKLYQSLTDGETIYKGMMKAEHLDAVLHLVRKSDLFTAKEKRVYFG